MPHFLKSALVAAATLTTAVLGQTSSHCNPMEKTCPPNVALGRYTEFDWLSSDINARIWNSTSTPIKHSTEGAEFKIVKSGDGPNMHTNFYIMFGSLSVVMKAAPGPGICSSIVLLSDTLDEIDWEFLGTNKTMVQSNYFGKGNTTTYDRAIYHKLDFAPQEDYHNYTLNWTKEKLDWIIDGKVVRTLLYGQALDGKNYPQTPMRSYLGAWPAGDSKNLPGVIEWAQARTDYSQAPWSMYVRSVNIQDYSTGSTYEYTDKTGSWQSIKATAGESEIIPELTRPIGPGAHWRSLSTGTRVAIIAGSIAGLFLIVAATFFFCFRSTRKGLVEAKKAEAEWEAQQREAVEWQAKYQADRASMMSSRKSLVTPPSGSRV